MPKLGGTTGEPTTRGPHAFWIVAALVAVIWLDWWTGPHLAISIFYALPVGLAAWWSGRPLGFVVAAIAMGVWTTIEVFDTPRPHPAYHAWNALVRGGTFFTIAYLLSRVRDLLRAQTALASLDGLTGLSNARTFLAAVEAELLRCRRTSEAFAIGYCDLDNFKQVNDQRGHAAGDALLRGVAEVLRDRLRATDLAARLGGDEFAFLLRATTPTGAEHVARDLHARTQQHVEAFQHGVGVSLGLVCFVESPTSADDAIRSADDLMYAVKHGGKRSLRCARWPEAKPESAA